MNWDEYLRNLRARLEAPRKMEEANKRLQEILNQRTKEDWGNLMQDTDRQFEETHFPIFMSPALAERLRNAGLMKDSGEIVVPDYSTPLAGKIVGPVPTEIEE